MKARSVVGRGQEGPVCDPDLSYTGRERESIATIINGMRKNKMLQRVYDYHTQHPYPFPGFFSFFVHSLGENYLQSTYFW